MILQVISTNPKDSRTIQAAGAHRIQLVSALQIGGLTPPSSILRKSLECVSIPTNVLLRHHNNGFQYTNQQKLLLMEDVIQCKEMKAQGVVIGGLNDKNQIDEEFMESIVKEVGGKMSITFHKASDYTDLMVSMKTLQKLKVDRILTQGGRQPITKNYEMLQKMTQLDCRTIILLGGGINKQNIKQITTKLKIKQIHVGTCVRNNKYGPIDQLQVQDLLHILDKAL